MTTGELHTTLDPALAAVYEQHGLTPGGVLLGGHAGALLGIAHDAQNQPWVVKTGADLDSASEVIDNMYGYQVLTTLGAASLVPPRMIAGTNNEVPYLIMPHLGKDVTRAAREDQSVNYTGLVAGVLAAALASVQEQSGAHAAGLQEYGAQLQRWYRSLQTAGLANDEDLEQLEAIDYARLSSDKSSLMLLDFTPDNLFATDGTVSFIDPWRQATYTGSFIPSLSQFVTLARDVYDLPGASEHSAEFTSAMHTLGEAMDLSPDQVEAQALLGASLQYALSGFVRIDGDPEQAAHFVQKSKDALKQTQELSS